jgi:hypothetical protein
MGFSVYYCSTGPVRPTKVDAIVQAASVLCRGRTWLGCESVRFSRRDDGRLCGGSKPNFQPHPDDVASAAREGLPNGTTRDMLDILCQLSREYGIDWEIGHDHSDGPVGYIRDGFCDGEVVAQIEAFADLGDILGDRMADTEAEPGGFPASASRGTDENMDDDDDAGSSILTFRPKGE